MQTWKAYLRQEYPKGHDDTKQSFISSVFTDIL